ncbi:nucleotide sugar dehydrogenase [Candidatus Poribacteria bacterium]|nr:nucleotide sugar dehydrogenase [Candidatus Poribacteria bacterium]
MLLDKIESRTAHAGIIGLGYVGLSLAIAIAEVGFRVTGIDINPDKVNRLKQGLSDVPDVSNERLSRFVDSGQFNVTTDYSVLNELDTINICVPTPLTENRTPDLKYIKAAVQKIAIHLHQEQLVILESTTYPGTTEDVVLPILKSSVTFKSDSFSSLTEDSNFNIKKSLKVGSDFYLAFSPERIEPGNCEYSLTDTPKIVGGVTQKCTQLASIFYQQFINKVYPMSSPRTAEMTKLLENTFRSVNIGLINEIALICDRMELDVWEIIDAASTKPFGFMPFYPGPGLGGHCIPIDPHYLSWMTQKYQYQARFIELASEINDSMPKYVLDKVINALNMKKKAINGSSILILGVSYKKDIGDTRESPAIDLIRIMLDKGARILYHDSYVSNITLGERGTFTSQDLSTRLVESVDCVVIIADHSHIDYDLISEHANLIVDTRNATRSIQSTPNNIIKL